MSLTRTIVFIYSEFQNQDLSAEILNILEEYDLGFYSIQVDSPESRKIINGKIQETPAFIVRTGNTLKYYYKQKALDFINAVIQKYPDRKKESQQQEPEEQEKETVIEKQVFVEQEKKIEPEPNKKVKKIFTQKQEKPKKQVKKEKTVKDDILTKLEDEISEDAGIKDTNEYFASSDEEGGEGGENYEAFSDGEGLDDDGISVVYSGDEEENIEEPSRKPSAAMQLAADMAAQRKGIMKSQFPGMDDKGEF